MHTQTQGRSQRKRRLFIAGKLVHQSHPCSQGFHVGPMVDTARFEEAGGMWKNLGTCARCGSTISRRQLARSA